MRGKWEGGWSRRRREYRARGSKIVKTTRGKGGRMVVMLVFVREMIEGKERNGLRGVFVV